MPPCPPNTASRSRGLLDEAREEQAQLRGVQSGTTAEVARTLLEHLSQSAGLIDRAVQHTAAAAVAAGVALEEVAQWVAPARRGADRDTRRGSQ